MPTPNNETTTMQTEKLAKNLWTARQTGQICELPEELLREGALQVSKAYDIQDAYTKAAGDDGEIIGYKIGATTQKIISMFGLEEPFYGPLYKSVLDVSTDQQNPLDIPLYLQHGSRIEAEFVVSMKNDLVRGDKDITVADVKDNMDWIAPGFEIVASRLDSSIPPTGPLVIADGGGNQHMVMGTPYKEWTTLDITNLHVALSIGDQPPIEGNSSMSITGNPLELVCWLLNHPRMHATGLKAGQIVSCGTCTGAVDLREGQKIIGNYGIMGKLAIKISSKSTVSS